MNAPQISDLIALRDNLLKLEALRAKDSLAVYAGLHIPQDIERDDLPALHDMPLAERYIPAAHHRKIIEKLEALERGEITRLMILAPPGSAKSSYASVLFPAWYLGRNPTHSVIAASQTQDLAERFGRRARNLVASDVHERVFGHGLAPDQRASGHWEVAEGGEYHSTGVQPFAGRRADCVPGWTMVQTQYYGPWRIDELYLLPTPCKVLSYDEDMGRKEYQTVLAQARRKAYNLIRVRTESGLMVECTENHQVYVNGDWSAASAIAVGDFLNRVVKETEKLVPGEQGQVRSDVVSWVETVRGETWVYDIEVEETHNFFANGILVHNCIICDDLLRGRKDADSKLVRNNTWEWILGDLRPRMKPDAKWVFITTRWHENDPAGRILPSGWNGQSGNFTARDGEEWEVLSFAAIIETNAEADCDPLGRKVGDILWPEWFTKEMLEQERRSQGRRNWDSLYQQKPRPDEGGILRRDSWRLWQGKMPPCEYVMSVYDTAFEEGEENDYSARTTWGIFWHEEKDRAPRYCVILLERWKERVEFPKLRVLAQEHFREWKPDRLLVEKKASGHSLIQELRRNRIPVTPIKVDRSKLARAHSVTSVFDDGSVFYPDKRWADEVLDECAAFPSGEHDDLTDTVVHALMFLRKQFWLEVKQDFDEDEPEDRQLNRGRLLG